MKYHSVLDLHTHTIVSGHAYCTLREMAKAASEKGLELLGITEHAPKMPGTCHKFYFENLKIVPREMYGIELLLGSKNPCINIIGHPDDGRYEVDYEALVQGAKEYGKILELNNHSMDPDCSRENAIENDTVMLNYCKKYQVPIVMDSDAHFDLLIGEFDMARELLTKLDFPEELVLNRSTAEVKKYLGR